MPVALRGATSKTTMRTRAASTGEPAAANLRKKLARVLAKPVPADIRADMQVWQWLRSSAPTFGRAQRTSRDAWNASVQELRRGAKGCQAPCPWPAGIGSPASRTSRRRGGPPAQQAHCRLDLRSWWSTIPPCRLGRGACRGTWCSPLARRLRACSSAEGAAVKRVLRQTSWEIEGFAGNIFVLRLWFLKAPPQPPLSRPLRYPPAPPGRDGSPGRLPTAAAPLGSPSRCSLSRRRTPPRTRPARCAWVWARRTRNTSRRARCGGPPPWLPAIGPYVSLAVHPPRPS